MSDILGRLGDMGQLLGGRYREFLRLSRLLFRRRHFGPPAVSRLRALPSQSRSSSTTFGSSLASSPDEEELELPPGELCSLSSP